MARSKEQIRRNMQRVKSKDSEIELILRKELWSRGLRYRKNYNKVIGKPDICFLKQKVAVFCDSEFWHGYNWGEERKAEFKRNKQFWIEKIERNINRDKEVKEALEKEGWKVLRFWGKEIKRDPKRCADIVEREIKIRNLY